MFVNQILICELQKISRVSVNNGVISSPGLISSCSSFLPVINVFFFFYSFVQRSLSPVVRRGNGLKQPLAFRVRRVPVLPS